MKKLNNKGYMLVEIILASVIAFSVAYYLINLTFKFKDQNMDLYNLTAIETAKINITKNIMNDLELGVPEESVCEGDNISSLTTSKDNELLPEQLPAKNQNIIQFSRADDIMYRTITKFCDSDSGTVIFYGINESNGEGEITISSKKLVINNNKLVYGTICIDTEEQYNNDSSYYTKTLSSGNEFTKIDCTNYNNRNIKIGITNIYSDEIEYIKLTW